MVVASRMASFCASCEVFAFRVGLEIVGGTFIFLHLIVLFGFSDCYLRFSRTAISVTG